MFVWHSRNSSGLSENTNVLFIHSRTNGKNVLQAQGSDKISPLVMDH